MKKKELENEIEAAAKYIYKILPQPIQGIVSVDWRYIPSKTVGGDAFGYDWIDQDHFFVYLLDVAGNGVKAALHLSQITHVLFELRKKKDSSLLHPKALFHKLNQEFPMEENDNVFFTMWYGVYHKQKHMLCFASAGHHAAILLPGYQLLQTSNPAIGVLKEAHFEEAHIEMSHGDVLYLVSDGVYELQKKDGSMQTFAEFSHILKSASSNANGALDALITTSQEVTGKKYFEDDFSVLTLQFLHHE